MSDNANTNINTKTNSNTNIDADTAERLTRMQDDLREGRISRREFLRAGAALGTLGALGVGAGAGSFASLSSLISPAQAAPKKGGKFTAGLAHGSTTDSLDPGSFENSFMTGSGFARYNFLTEIDTSGRLIGELAERWEVTPDAKTWTFHLRKGVEFHNGKRLRAQDVVASLNHHRGADSTSAAKPILADVTEIKARRNRVVVTLAVGNADFPFLVSDFHLPIMPSKDGKADWASGIGTGAYAGVEFEPGVRFRMRRNRNYWKEGRGHFDEVEMITINDVAARTNALTTGEIDFMDRCEIKTLHLLERRRNLRVEELSGTGHYSMPMRTNLAPYDDNNIRLALKYALDREALLSTILRGHGYLGNDHPIGKSQRFFAAELPQKRYDADRAKHYLRAAGRSKLDVELTVAEAAFTGAVDASVLFSERAREAGVNIRVKRVPNDGYWSNVWNTDNAPWCWCYWNGRPTEDWMFSAVYSQGAKWNDANWQHARFNRLLTEARAELDEAKRREMYVEMQRLVSDEGGTVIPVFNNYIHALSNDIAHEAQMGANWENDGQRYMERWWRV